MKEKQKSVLFGNFFNILDQTFILSIYWILAKKTGWWGPNNERLFSQMKTVTEGKKEDKKKRVQKSVQPSLKSQVQDFLFI